ncbi:hypothetical protein QH494_13665 [Sphingomonas sp. AR_OL41]|uniref:hypothetical protein n=1 Tax=Sphingomonas sp. AR_OL41 TaxID=3042729 RepID=UPI002480CB6F|nr:hypothetical protein [Sphingomonas sp. AR_OL41]MDH7973231.1 hypothetical protein [Sphingomonas sp. AR_OL41]
MMNRTARKFALAAMSIGLVGAAPPVAAPGDVKPPCVDTGRACLEAVARTYIDGLLAHSGAKIPLAPDARRTENALTNARGEEIRESFVRTDMIEAIKDIRFYTDVSKGEVVAFFLLDIDLKEHNGGGQSTTMAGGTEYRVAITKPAGTYTVHEAERFRIKNGLIHEVEIIAHVEDGKGQGSGWPVERDAAVTAPAK